MNNSTRLTQSDPGLTLSASGMLQTYITDFMQTKRRKWRPKTYTNYKSILNLYSAHVGPDHWPPTHRGVLSWLDALHTSRVSQTTQATYWTHLRSFFNFMEKSGELSHDENPVHKIVAMELDPEPEDLPPVAFPDDDLPRLFDFLEDQAANGNVYAIRDLALLRFAYITGAREGEIAQLTVERHDLDNYEALILAWTSKGKKLRTIYFDGQVYREISAWLEVRPNQPGVHELFVSLGGGTPKGSSLKPHALYDILQRRLVQAGIPRREFHALRHSSALDALDEGISLDKIQKQLGHQSLHTTQRYLRGRDPDRARAYRERSLSKRLRRNSSKFE